MTTLHPFDPITPGEITLATKILQVAFPGVTLRYKKIDLQEPIKAEVVPYIEAERLGKPLPRKPTRLLQVLFHRMDTGAFFKGLLNADSKSVVYAKELPREIQVGPPSGRLAQTGQVFFFFFSFLCIHIFEFC